MKTSIGLGLFGSCARRRGRWTRLLTRGLELLGAEPLLMLLTEHTLKFVLKRGGLRGDEARVLGVKLLLGAEIARQQEVEQAPQLDHIVLYGRTGEYESMRRSDLLDRLGQLALRALDQVALVQDAIVPLLRRRYVLNVVTHDVVRADEHVGPRRVGLFRRVAEERASQALAFGDRARVDERPQTLDVDEPLDLVVPVIGERRGTYDDRGRELGVVEVGIVMEMRVNVRLFFVMITG